MQIDFTDSNGNALTFRIMSEEQTQEQTKHTSATLDSLDAYDRQRLSRAIMLHTQRAAYLMEHEKQSAMNRGKRRRRDGA